MAVDLPVADRTHLRRQVLQILDRPLCSGALLAGVGDELGELLGLKVEHVRHVGRRGGEQHQGIDLVVLL